MLAIGLASQRMGKSKRGKHKTKFEKMPLSRFLLDGEKLDTNACVPLSYHKVVITKTKWMELPSDILLMIFQKMGPISILTKAILLCRDWLELARNEPLLWRKVDMTCHGKKFGPKYLQDIACIAVNWSAGQLEEFSAEGFGSDDLLQYLADSTSNLKTFSLISCRKISQEALEKTIKRWPLLEEIELTSYCMCPPEFYQTIGLSCPQLKCFRLNTIYIEYPDYDDIDEKDSIAHCIGKTMHNLCSLQLIGSRLTMEGLHAILEGCTKLESLDVRNCYQLTIDQSIQSELERLKHLRLPVESTDDYKFTHHVYSSFAPAVVGRCVPSMRVTMTMTMSVTNTLTVTLTLILTLRTILISRMNKLCFMIRS